MSFSLGYPVWLLVGVLLSAGGLTYWAYHHTIPELPRLRRMLLGGLRFMSLALLAFLLFKPVFRSLERTRIPPTVAVLVDNSQSISTADTAEASPPMREALQHLLGSMDADVPRVFLFGSTTQTVPGGLSSVTDSLDFRQPRTDIAQALEHARAELQQENLSGVVLLSDGQYNTGRNPLYTADRFPVPIHTVVVGDTTRERDVQVQRISTNEIAYTDTELPVQVGLRADGYPGQRVTVRLTRSGTTLDSEQITLPDGAAEVPVDLSLEPQEQGLQQFQIHVSELSGEANHRNNTGTFTVRVLDSKKRVLLLGAAPGPDVAAVRQILKEASNLNVESLIQKSPGTFYEGQLPDDFSDINVVVLAGYPGTAAQSATVERMADAVAEDDIPLFFLITGQTDLQALRDQLGDVLPVVPKTVRSTFVDAQLIPSPAGRQHPILEIPSAPLSLFAELPPLSYNESRWQPSPDANVLATTRVQGVQLQDPMLVIRQRTGSRSAAFLGADTWRWLVLPEDLDQADPLWPTLFSNILQWISTPDNDQRLRVEPVRDVFAGGETVQLTGEAYDESLNPVSSASITVQVTSPGGDRYPYTMKSVGNGRYVLDIGSLPEGTYSYTAEATREGRVVGSDQGSFAVGALTLEFKETRADAGLMRQLARRSGGLFYFADSLGGFSEQLQQRGALEASFLEETQETELWHLYSLMAVVIVLLTAEWFFRKRSGMI